MTLLDELLGRIEGMPAGQRAELERAAAAGTAALQWVPNPGPQTGAYYSEADELLYGGEAGGGKTDLLIGVALNLHQNARILRRVKEDAGELGDRLVEVLGTSKGYASKPPGWRGRNGAGKPCRIQFRGCEQEKDKHRFKGRARDFIGYDELADFTESQYIFINTWNRSTDPEQRCRVIGATNGPTRPEGQWILRRWGAWLDPTHPNPAKDGELRWFLTVDGVEREVDGPGPHEVPGRGMVKARSRSFIRSKLSDNPDLARTDYGANLEALPEELRRVYRDGDFTVGLRDADYQLIPAAWVDAAMARWKEDGGKAFAMTAIGLDVAPGGIDQTVLAPRHGGWFAPLVVERTKDKDGGLVAGLVVRHRRDACPVVVDMGGGWGGDALIVLEANGVHCHAFMGVDASTGVTRDGKLKFANKRAESYWRFREALDPGQTGGSAIALPPDQALKEELCAPRWRLERRGVLLEEKNDIEKRLGRSPDRADAVTMCLSAGEAAVRRERLQAASASLPTRANVGYSKLKRRR